MGCCAQIVTIHLNFQFQVLVVARSNKVSTSPLRLDGHSRRTRTPDKFWSEDSHLPPTVAGNLRKGPDRRRADPNAQGQTSAGCGVRSSSPSTEWRVGGEPRGLFTVLQCLTRHSCSQTHLIHESLFNSGLQHLQAWLAYVQCIDWPLSV